VQPAGATLARVGLFGFDILLLHAHRDAHAAADAEPGEPLPGIALLHLVEQRHQHACTRRTDRVPDRDGAAIDVDLVGVPAEILARAGLRGKRLGGLSTPDRATAASCSSPACSFGGFVLVAQRERAFEIPSAFAAFRYLSMLLKKSLRISASPSV
jgi:hypothetical protein